MGCYIQYKGRGCSYFGDWSLIMGRGATNRKHFFEVVLTWELEILAIMIGGGGKKFPLFKVRLRWLGVV